MTGLKYLWARLREDATWAGIGVAALGAAQWMPQLAFVSFLCGTVAVLLKSETAK